MKIPHQISSGAIRVSNIAYQSHIARSYAFASLAEKLGREMLNKAFSEPVIIRAFWEDREDYHKMYTDIIGKVNWMPFKDWAIENLRVDGDAEFGRILEIPLTNERMMVERDMGIFYTK